MRGVIAVTCMAVVAIAAAGTVKRSVSSTTTALLYMSKFGYLPATATNPSSGALLDGRVMEEAIKEFQRFANLNQTGLLDDETILWMNMPRCGNKDKVGYGSNARKKRYAQQGSRWRVRSLTYKITKYPLGLYKSEVDTEIARALKVWENVADLTFTPVTSGKIHIEIRFETTEHGDGDPFDGPGGTLAHAYFPLYGGDAHFDDSETWTVDSYRGTNLFQVAAHEFGHSLGLSHSDDNAALMAPFYRGFQNPFKLHKDDILGIQSLYGDKTNKKPASTTTRRPITTRPAVVSELCKDSKFDAIVTATRNSEKTTYVFKGEKFWELTDSGIAQGYPRMISTNWEGLPGNIDAAFTWTNGKTYIFKGSQYWRYTNLEMDPDYPKFISKGFKGIPNGVDAAFVWSGNGKIYFFKGSEYWRFDPDQRPPVGTSYPKDISNWEGLPNNIDDALQYSNGFTYFFQDGKYWRFNDRAFAIDTGSPTYPRDMGEWWFGCNAKSGSQQLDSQGLVRDKFDAKPLPGDATGDDTFDAE